jgi:predicted dehydrogenase
VFHFLKEFLMRSKNVKVGMVGLGLVSTSHYKGYASHPDAKIVAVCDLDKARAEEFAKTFNIPEVYTNYDEMLGQAEINAIDIATPTYLHVPMAMKAIKAGKHVHCEKPFCRSTGEGLLVCKAADQAGLKLVVGETYVFITSHVKARELIEAGEIGRPLQIRQRHGAWLEKKIASVYTGPADRNWRIDPEKSGGGDYPWIFDHTGHFFATAEYFMPGKQVAEVYALGATTHGTYKSGAAHDPYMTAAVDAPMITWKYDDTDCQGVWMRAERLNGKYDYMRGFSTTIVGETGMIEVLGEGGYNLFWEGAQQHLILHREKKETICFRFDEGGDDVWQSDICYYSQGHINQVRHFIDCVINDKVPRYKGEDGVHAVHCTLATILSAREGRPVKLSEVSPDFTAYRH